MQQRKQKQSQGAVDWSFVARSEFEHAGGIICFPCRTKHNVSARRNQDRVLHGLNSSYGFYGNQSNQELHPTEDIQRTAQQERFSHLTEYTRIFERYSPYQQANNMTTYNQIANAQIANAQIANAQLAAHIGLIDSGPQVLSGSWSRINMERL